MLALLLAASVAVEAPGAALHRTAARIGPGGFAWGEGGAEGMPLRLEVSRALQRLYVYRGEALIGVAAISTGMRGHATPLGSYTVLQKALRHRSNIYSNAPMPYMQRLTWSGLALHAGHNPGRPASHGCIRLPAAFAAQLYALTDLGVTVTISDYPDTQPLWLTIDPDVLKPAAAPILAYADLD